MRSCRCRCSTRLNSILQNLHGDTRTLGLPRGIVNYGRGNRFLFGSVEVSPFSSVHMCIYLHLPLTKRSLEVGEPLNAEPITCLLSHLYLSGPFQCIFLFLFQCLLKLVMVYSLCVAYICRLGRDKGDMDYAAV